MMRRGSRTRIFLWMVAALACLPGRTVVAQNGLPPLPVVLAHLRTNLQLYVSTLPSFSATEEIISEQVSGDQVKRKEILVSEIRVERASQSDPENPVTEHRQVKTFNGRPATKRHYKLPLVITGAFGDAFQQFIGAAVARCYRYTLARANVAPSRPVLLLHFSAKQDELSTACTQVAPDSSGDFVLDESSFQILRADKRFPHSNIHGFSDLRISYAYAPVTLGGKSILLPTLVTGQMAKGKTALRYSAAYRDYHEFAVSFTILPATGSPGSGSVSKPR